MDTSLQFTFYNSRAQLFLLNQRLVPSAWCLENPDQEVTSMKNLSNPTTGFGRMQPADAPEYAEITITVENGLVAAAEFACAENDTLRRCAETLCRQIVGFPAADLFQMNNNVIYYNMEEELALDELYLASVCVLAAKRAAADWCRKNGVLFDEGCCGCG